MPIENLPLFNAMNKEEVHPVFPNPKRPLTAQESHFAIMEKVHACISEVNRFEKAIEEELNKYFDKTDTENHAFKEAIQTSYNTFLATVQQEINNFETDMEQNYQLHLNDFDTRVADFQTAINNEFLALQESVVNLTSGKVEELEALRISLVNNYNSFTAEVNTLIENFKTHLEQEFSETTTEQDRKIEEYRQYMVDNLEPTLKLIFNQKASNGEIAEIMASVYGGTREFKGSKTYDEIHALNSAANGDYYYCTTNEHYYQKTATSWVDIGTGDISLDNLLAFQNWCGGEMIDLRTDTNNTEWERSGDNFRNFTSNNYYNTEKIKEILTGLISSYDMEDVEVEHTEGKFLDGHGELVTPNATPENYHVIKAAVSEGDVLLITAQGYIYNHSFAFYDSNDKVIMGDPNRYKDGKHYKNYIVVAPPKSAYILVNGVHYLPASVKKVIGINYVTDGVKDYLNNFSNTPINQLKMRGNNIEFNSKGRYVIPWGKYEQEITDGTAYEYLISDLIEVTAGKIYHIVCSTNYSNYAYLFYDEKQSPLDGERFSEFTIVDKNVIVPFNAKYIRICTLKREYGFSIEECTEIVGLAPAKSWVNKKWVCLGDSLTEFNQRASKNYHDYVHEETGIEVVNMGLSGSGYAKRSGDNNAYYQRVMNIPTDADVITIFSSFNDLSSGLPLGNVTDTVETTLCGAINKTLDNLFSIYPLARVGVTTPTPWHSTKPTENESADNYVKAIIDICYKRGIPCLDLFHCSGLRPWDEAFRKVAYSKDPEGVGNHPDETGHMLIAPKFREFLKTLI